jgi:uncharacterized phage protein gp47/JayE
MPTAASIASKMMLALRASEPDLDTSIGTPLRKILDAVSESIAEAYTDQHLINYAYDIDSKTGGDLDDFVQLFGMARLPAQRAQGVVTFTRPNNATSQQIAQVIPPGTQVIALTNPPVYHQTTVSAILNPAQLSVDVPVQAVSAGTAGNVAAGLLSTLVQISGTISGATNAAATTGGTSLESDEQLRDRFKKTVFRSLAGTEAMYSAVALEIPQDPATPGLRAVSQVNVIGSTKRHREQVQLVSGQASTTLTGMAYIFADNVFCGSDIDAGSMLTSGIHYTFTPSNPSDGITDATAVLSALNTAMPDGLYDLDFEYVPQASRNDPGNTRFGRGGINNRVDVWANGQVLDTATQSVVFTSNKLFSTTPSSLYYRNRFRQSSDTQPIPLANDVFLPLAYGPIVTVPSTIPIGGTTYVLGTDYWIAYQDDCFGHAASSLYGLAWNGSHKPAENALFSLTYTYNKVARLLQDGIDQWRLVGTDAKAHCGKRVPLRFNLAVMYDRRFDPTAVKTDIDTALGEFLNSLGFEASLQVSDILQVVHNTPGVDNVRFLTSTDDATFYSIGRMSLFTTNLQVARYASSGRVIDVQFPGNEYPVFHSTRIVAKAANSFGQA